MWHFEDPFLDGGHVISILANDFGLCHFLDLGQLFGVKADGKPEFSNQNLSPRLMFANWRAMMHANVGPTTAPGSLNSEIPPDHKSMSSTCLTRSQCIS